MNNDLISRSELKEAINTWDKFACLPDGKIYPFRELKHPEMFEAYIRFRDIIKAIDGMPIVEEAEKPFITECRNTAIKENLPLYFVYYEETGVFEVYVTETKELFEKRHCSKHLPNYKFNEIVTTYLDGYLEWRSRRNDKS